MESRRFRTVKVSNPVRGRTHAQWDTVEAGARLHFANTVYDMTRRAGSAHIRVTPSTDLSAAVITPAFRSQNVDNLSYIIIIIIIFCTHRNVKRRPIIRHATSAHDTLVATYRYTHTLRYRRRYVIYTTSVCGPARVLPARPPFPFDLNVVRNRSRGGLWFPRESVGR